MFLAVGFIELNQIAAADVATMGASEKAAEQIERERMTVHFAAGDEKFPVIRLDLRRASPDRTDMMQQCGSGLLGEVAKVHSENAAPRGRGPPLQIGKIGEGLACGNKTEGVVFCVILRKSSK